MAQTITHRNLDVMVSAIKVQSLKPIFEDDFVERGMTAENQHAFAHAMYELGIE